MLCYDLGLLKCVRSRHSKSAEFLNVPNVQVIQSMDFVFPDGLGIFQDDNAKIHRALERVEYEDTWVSGSTRTHFHTWIGRHRVLTLPPLKVFGVCWKRLKEWFDSPVINTKSWPKWMQLWMEINVVTLHKVVETMPQQMHSLIKAKVCKSMRPPLSLLFTQF